MTNITVEKIHPASIQLDKKVNKYVNKIREKYVGGSNEQPFFYPNQQTTEVSYESSNKVDNKNENGSRFYYISALTSLGIQFGTIVYWYFRS